MSFLLRIRTALRVTLIHLLTSSLLALFAAVLVFGFWYPGPYAELAGGQALFLLLLSVDVICGPLLTLVIYNPKKPRAELVRDISFVILIQLAALCYGLYSLMQARPIWLAFEGDRFRVVSVPDLLPGSLEQAPKSLQTLSLTGPKLLGVRLVDGSDPTFQSSIKLSLEGYHPAFRPSRWVSYENQRVQVGSKAKPLSQLKPSNPEQTALLNRSLQRRELAGEALGYIPLMTEHSSDWIVLVRLRDGEPVDYLPIDGWID